MKIMISPAPKPVLDFFVRYLKNPNDRELCDFCFNLLGLELARAYQSTALDPSPFELSDGYRSEIALAQRVRDRVSDERRPGTERTDLVWHWLTLLGHRIAAERGLATEGTTTLSLVAAVRLKLPLKETEIWSDEMLFRQYTETVLRDEWDYPGLMPHHLDRVCPVEGTEDV